MVNLSITHNVFSNIALSYSTCIFKLNCESHLALPLEWQKNKNTSSFGKCILTSAFKKKILLIARQRYLTVCIMLAYTKFRIPHHMDKSNHVVEEIIEEIYETENP